MSTLPLSIVLHPALVEEVVLRATAGTPRERSFRQERDRLYLIADADEREAQFQQLHLAWFEQLQLGEPIRTALAELPILAETCARCMVAPAAIRQDEGADLLVAIEPASVASRTVLIRLQPAAFGEAAPLLAFLRAELLHVADMVDPAFAYHPDLPAGAAGPSHERLLRERYRVVWNVSVAGRLVRRAVAGPGVQDQAQREFAAAFPMLGAAAGEAFERFFGGAACTHAALMAFAVAPRGTDEHGLVPGGRCPLCRFPTYAPDPAPDRLPPDVIDRILADFPSWRPAAGVCRQCSDLYRVRALETVAAGGIAGG